MSTIHTIQHGHLSNHTLSESVETNLEHTIPVTSKNTLRYHNMQSTSNSKITKINCSLMKLVTSAVHNNSASNLNLTTRHLDKLKTLSTSLNSTRRSTINTHNNNNYVQTKIDNNDYKKNRGQEVGVDVSSNCQADLVLSLHNYLKNDTALDSYIIILFFDYIKGTDLISKQTLTVIPFIDGSPSRSVSDISVIDINGDIDKYNLPTYLYIGGYKYTQDWMSIEYKNTIYNSINLHKIVIESSLNMLNGLCLDHNLEDKTLITSNTNIKLYIPGISEIWK